VDEKYWVIENDQIAGETLRIANEFLYSKMQEGKSEGTLKKYCFLLKKFLLHCPKPLGELTPGDVLDWLNSQYGGKKERTRALSISALSVFFKYCHEEHHLDRVLIKRSWRPRIPKSIPKYLDKNEQAACRLQAEKLPLRDRMIYEFLLSSGCRRSELAGLDVKDVDLGNRTAIVLGKGNKTRDVHFSEGCAILLQQYLSTHPKDTDALFLNRSGTRLSDKWFYRVTIRLGEMAGLSAPFNPHRLRHSFATNFLARGAGLDFISGELGHADVSATQIYADIPSKELIALYRKYMG
jgi:site-specific recombinase XerD